LRIGLFGGTFDPIHQAHLRMANAAAEQCRLDRVLLVPASIPPHRTRGAFASYEDRLRMVEIACDGHALLAASRLDDHPEKSYSIRTVERLRARLPEDASIRFIIGADAFAELTTWHQWKELAKMVTFVVVGRPGATYDDPEGVRIERLHGVDLPISSSEIRAKLAAGDLNVDLPRGVLAYIQDHHLYGLG
jgi:nicotinate-nucleotide adenylyltransferase